MKALIFMSLLALTTSANAQCENTVVKAAKQSLAASFQADEKEFFLVRVEIQSWTEAVGNNIGQAEVAMELNNKVTYLRASLKQIGRTSKCEVTKLTKISRNTIDPLALQAEKYRLAIRDALHYSEGDAEWTPFYSHKKVKSFDKEEIARALNATEQVSVFSKQASLDFINDYADNEDESVFPGEREKYSALRQALFEDFKEIRVIKVGKPDSGGLDLYILGITPDGELVGLQTITVET